MNTDRHIETTFLTGTTRVLKHIYKVEGHKVNTLGLVEGGLYEITHVFGKRTTSFFGIYLGCTEYYRTLMFRDHIQGSEIGVPIMNITDLNRIFTGKSNK